MANRRAALEPGLRPPHPNEPAMRKKPKTIISTSAMFKRPHPPTREAPSTGHALKPVTNIAKAQDRGHGISKASHKPQVSSILKKPGEVRLSEQHPLAVAFKETTTAYRSTLHSNATTSLHAARSSLLANLHATASIELPSGERTLFQAACAAAEDDLASALGDVELEVWNTDVKGRRFLSRTTMTARMEAFAQMVREEEREVERLRGEYESVVGELYWVAAAAMGDERAREVFGIVDEGGEDDGDEEGVVDSDGDTDGLFVEVVWEKGGRREGRSAMAPPPSQYGPLDPMPSTPRKQIAALKQQVQDVGIKAMEDLGEEEKERAKQWKEKQKKIVELLQVD